MSCIAAFEEDSFLIEYWKLAELEGCISQLLLKALWGDDA